jgi:hypothetical protein
VASVSGAVGSVTGNVGGNVAGSVNSVTTQVIADVTAISGDSVAADNVEADYDGTGYNKSTSTVGTATNLTTNNDKTGYSISGTKQTLDALNDVSTAQVNSEVDTALSDIGLDHLVSAAVTGTDITDDSIIAFMVSKSATADWDTFDNTTDSLEAIADTSAPSAAVIADAVWDEARSGHVAAGSFGQGVASVQGNVTGSVASVTGSVNSVTTQVTADVTSVSGDSTAADNLEADYDGTGYNKSASTIGTAAALTANNDKTGYSISGTKTTLDALNDVSTAEVNTEVDTALSDIGLDHLISAAVIGADITDDSIIAQMVSKSATADWDTFDNTTDSLEAITDTGFPSAATIADAVWDEARSGHVAGGSFGEGVASVQGNITGSVASVVGAVGSVTGAVGSVTGNVGGNVAGSVNSVTTQVAADVTAISGDSTAADNLELDYDGTGYNKSASTIGTAAALTANNDKTGYSISGAKTTLDALNDVSTAQVNAEVDTALSDIDLDHLISAAVIGTDVADDSIIAQIVSKSATADWDTFDNTSDSLEAISDAGGGGLSQQQVRDSMKLAPSVGAPAAGSVDEHLDDILTDTNEMQGKLPTNNIMGSSVKTDKDDEIDAINSTVSTNLDTTVSSRSDFDETSDQVTVATNNDKTGYSISGAKTTLDALNS